MVGGPIRARAFGQPAAHLPAHSRADAGGISQVPRRSVLCLCPGPRPRPDRRPLDPDGVVDAAPAQPTAKAPAIIISRLLTRLRHLLPTLHDGRRRRHARLASGWLADLYREGVEPSGSRQKVSELHVHPPFLSFPCRKGRLFQGAVRRTEAGAALSVPLHPPGRHLEPPPRRGRRRRRRVSVEDPMGRWIAADALSE
jgi:hypothetical protein